MNIFDTILSQKVKPEKDNRSCGLIVSKPQPITFHKTSTTH